MDIKVQYYMGQAHVGLKKNIKKIYILKFFTMFLVLMPVIVPFFETAKIGMQGVYLILAVFSVTVFILEIPSGYFSDLLGRRKTLIISNFLKGVGFSMFPFASDISVFIAAEIVLGIALSLNSGTDTAILYDTLEEIRPGKAQVKYLGRSLSYFAMGEALAALMGSVLLMYSFSLNNLAVISAFMSWITFFISFSLIEPPRVKMTQSHRQNFRYIFQGLFKQSKLLNLIILNTIFSFSGTLIAVWLFQKYWNEIGIPLMYFGFLWALTNFIVSIAGRNAHRIEKKCGSFAILICLGLLPILGYLGIYLVTSYYGILVCLIFQVSRGIGQVILKDALNKRVTTDFRATANSISQMGVRVIFILIGPILGGIIDTEGIHYASGIMGLFYILVFIFILFPLLREKKNFMQT